MWTWVKSNPLIAGIIVVISIVALAAAADGVSARRAASRYFDLAKGWAKAYERDTEASRREYDARIKALTASRDAYRERWEAASKKMDAPWKQPKGAKELKERFTRLGYAGVLR